MLKPKLVSDGKRYSVHAYFDLVPENSDGGKVVYTRFTGGTPKRGSFAAHSGQVVVVDRAAGEERIIGEFTRNHGHKGAFARWLNDNLVSFQDDGPGLVTFVKLDSGKSETFTGGCESHHPKLGGLFIDDQGMKTINPETGDIKILAPNEMLMTLAHCAKRPDPAQWKMRQPKTSPSGTRIAAFIGLHPDVKEENRQIRVFTCQPDGKDLKLLAAKMDGQESGLTHWSFYDDHSIYGYDLCAKGAPLGRWDFDGNLIEILHRGPGNHACLSPDHKWLVTDGQYGQDPTQIMRYEKGGDNPQVLVEMPRLSGAHPHPTISADGKRIYFNGSCFDGQGCQLCMIEL